MNKSAPKIAVLVSNYVEQEKLFKLLIFVAEHEYHCSKIYDFIETQRQYMHYTGKIIYINDWRFGNPYEYDDGNFINSPDFSKQFKILTIENDWEEIVDITYKAISKKSQQIFLKKIVDIINNELNN